MSNRINFSRICGGYLFAGFLIAVLISPDYRGPDFLSPLLELVPFVSLFQSPVNHLSSIPIFFLAMWTLMPVVLFLLAKHPQKDLPIYANKSALTLLYVTALAIALFLLISSAFYLKAEMDSVVTRGDAVIALASRYRFFLGVVGGAFMVTTAIAAYILFVLVPRLWIGYFSENN